MPRFSANLGYLWKELPLPEAIRAAQKAGFEAVEFHEPYNYPTEEIREVLEETGLKMLGLNTCLLYTSPSPRDATLSRMPSSA